MKPPGKVLRTRPLLLPRMHLTTKFLPVLNLDFDNSVAIFLQNSSPTKFFELEQTQFTLAKKTPWIPYLPLTDLTI